MKINQRLFDHYGIDTRKDLGIKPNCRRPFDTILIDKRGSCYACECQSWLPQSIGNLQVKTLAEIISNSPVRRHLQSSIEDGSYRYCNNKQCSYLLGEDFAYFPEDRPSDTVEKIRLAIDDSCNLRCPSCRNTMVFHKEGTAYQLGIRLADRINDWLSEQRHRLTVHIGSDGDPFASHVYRHFMQNTPNVDHIRYSILTNGLMFKEFHKQVPHVMSNLQDLGVSIDGASKETYEKLRLGGKWDKILEALECMAEQKNKHGFRFTLHFVVQKDNYHEMNAIIDLGEKYGADAVWLNKIEDWGTNQNFAEQNIWDSPDFRQHLDMVVKRIHQRNDRFIDCPTLINESVLNKGTN